MTADDQTAGWICPKIGCMKSTKAPFKHGSFIQNIPKCPVHDVEMVCLQDSLVFALDEITNFVYDKSIIPPQHFLDKLPHDLDKARNFVMDWLWNQIAFRKYDKSGEYLDALMKNYWKRNVSKIPLSKGSKLRNQIVNETVDEMNQFCLDYLRNNRQRLEKLFKNRTYNKESSKNTEYIDTWLKTSYNDLKPTLTKELFKEQSENDMERYKTVIDLLLTAQNAANMQGKDPPLKKITDPSKLLKTYADFHEKNLTSEITSEDIDDALDIVNDEESFGCYATQVSQDFMVRKFSVPLQKNEMDELRKVFITFRQYENKCVEHVLSNPRTENYQDFINHFRGMGKEALQNAKTYFKIENLKLIDYKNYELNSRSKRSAFLYPYNSIRENIIRWEYLKKIASLLPEYFKNTADLKSFLSQGTLSHNTSLQVLNTIYRNCFGKTEKKSMSYLNILLGQLRNLMLKEHIFEDIIKGHLTSLNQDSNVVCDELLQSFTFTKKSKEFQVMPENLKEFFQKIYARSLKTHITRQYTLYQKQNDPLKYPKLLTKIANIEEIQDKNTLNRIVSAKIQYIFDTTLINLDLLTEWSNEILHSMINDFLTNTNLNIEKSVLKPQFNSFSHQDGTSDDFIAFIKNQLKNSIKSIVSTKIVEMLRINPTITVNINQFITNYMNNFSNLPKPHFKKLTFPIVDKDRIWSQSFNNGSPYFDFYPMGKRKHIFNLGISNDTLQRLAITDEDSFNSRMKSNPTLILKGNRLIVAQPLDKNKVLSNASTDSSIQTHSDKEIVMGIDLGLKHYAVLSIWEKDLIHQNKSKEIARYFLNHDTVI
jgi:hypothetical protein